MKVSAIINTLNEADNLANALRSIVTWVDDIVVVDMHSTDTTVQIARAFGARVFMHEQTGFVEPARNFAVSQTKHDWVLLLDADEMVPEPLSVELLKIASEDRADVVYIPKCNYFVGAPLRYTFVGWGNDKHAQFFKKSKLSFVDRIHRYETPASDARKLRLRAKLELAIQHFGYLDLSHFADKIERYTTIEAEQALARGETPSLARAFWDAIGEFLSHYLKYQGFRDGWRGFYYSAFMAHYYLAKWGKLHALREVGRREDIKKEYQSLADTLVKAYEDHA